MDCGRYYDQEGELGFKSWDLTRFKGTLKNLLNLGSLLDVGCGEGYWLKFLSERTKLQLFGSDVSPNKLDISRRNLDNKDIPLSVEDIRKLSYENGEFDQVTALEVLEHVPQWQKGLDELIRVASKRVVITVPYNQKLIYEICPNCGGKAYIDGHLHSFTEKDFQDINIDGKVSFKSLQHSADYYVKRALKEILVKTKKRVGINNGSGRASTICISCYDKVLRTKYSKSYKKYSERAINRLSKLISNYPEFLLVEIDK